MSFEWLYRIEESLVKIITMGMVLASLALAFLMVFQVIMRYVIKLPFLGIEECAPLLALWAYFLGAAYSVRIREHIMGGILVLVCKKPSVIKAIRFLTTLLCLLVTLIFLYFLFKNTLFNMNLGRLSIHMRWPKYIWDLAVVVGFSLCTFYFLVQLILEFLDLRTVQAGQQG